MENDSCTEENFSIQTLWYYLSPSIETFEFLDTLINSLCRSGSKFPLSPWKSNLPIGGSLLSFLANCTVSYGGNPVAKRLYNHLLQKAYIPFNEMLVQWISSGELNDPFNEFMIRERILRKELVKQSINENYWNRKYYLETTQIPTFLHAHKEKILNTGKYLNVLKECGRSISLDSLVQESHSGDSQTNFSSDRFFALIRILPLIDLGYLNSNQTLLKYLTTDLDLLGHLQSIKTFFLLDKSDYLTHFLDLAADSLGAPVEHVVVSEVDSLLDLAIRTSSNSYIADRYRNALSVQFSSISLYEQLNQINSTVGIDMKKHLQNLQNGVKFSFKDSLYEAHCNAAGIEDGPLLGINAVMFKFDVEFPLSLIFNKKTITKYQMLFRHLLKCKVLERHLTSNWLKETCVRTASKNYFSEAINVFLAKLSSLRGRMLHFIQQIIYFMFFEVVNPRWEDMEKSVFKAATMDELLAFHENFLDTCLKECMLTTPKLITVMFLDKIICSLIKTCQLFSDFALHSLETLDGKICSKFGSTLESLNLNNEISSSFDYMRILDEMFMSQIRAFIECIEILGISETARLASLLSQLDYNGYYAHQTPVTEFITNPIVPVS